MDFVTEFEKLFESSTIRNIVNFLSQNLEVDSVNYHGYTIYFMEGLWTAETVTSWDDGEFEVVTAVELKDKEEFIREMEALLVLYPNEVS